VAAPEPYVALTAYAGMSVVLAVGLMGVAALLRHRVRGSHPDKHETYECGELPHGPAWRKTPAGFYLLALLFILFDAEAAFLFLWAESLRSAGMPALVAMVAFLGILLLGWIYAWRQGDLSWRR
jgi:NADH-quinone oxidoreductase subunit A